MNKINLEEKQVELLVNTMAGIVYELKKNKDVLCIYYAPYINLGNIKGNVIKITVVASNNTTNDLERKCIEFNSSFKDQRYLDKLGVKIDIGTDSPNYYTVCALNPSELKRKKELYNSIILYDKTLEYTRIKERAVTSKEENDSYIDYYNNRAFIVPPIDEKLEYALGIEQLKRESKAVKDFTKTECFQYIKDMK